MSETERSVYSYLDWIGDVGGLNDGLSVVFMGIAGLLNYNYYTSYLISKLFKVDDNDPSSKTDQDKSDGRQSLRSKLHDSTKRMISEKANKNIDYTKLYSMKMLFFDLIP